MPSRLAVLLTAAVVVGACSAASPAPGTSAPPGSSPAATVSPGVSGTPTPAGSAPVSPSTTAGPTLAPPSPSAGPAIWTMLTLAGAAPAAREDHTWTIDPAGRTAYLFGGRAGATVFGDLWAYDLATDAWRELKPAGAVPPARFGHSAVWVPAVGLVVFAGQAGATAFFNDLWTYEPGGNAWRQLPSGGSPPVPRYGSCVGLAPDGRLWISHGFTAEGTRFADTRAYDLAAGSWSDETPDGERPVERCLHGCFWSVDGRFVLFGGQTTGAAALGDLWALTVGGGEIRQQWEQVKETLPPPRNLYALARRADDAIVFGGGGEGGSFLSDAWIIDAATLAARPLPVAGAVPPGRRGAELVDDPAGGRLLLYGGEDASGPLADVWALVVP